MTLFISGDIGSWKAEPLVAAVAFKETLWFPHGEPVKSEESAMSQQLGRGDVETQCVGPKDRKGPAPTTGI